MLCDVILTSWWPPCETPNFLFVDVLCNSEAMYLSDFHWQTHAIFTCPIFLLLCPIGMLAAVNSVTLCLFQLCCCEAN